jgi:hypothetical protein
MFYLAQLPVLRGSDRAVEMIQNLGGHVVAVEVQSERSKSKG